MTTHTSHTHSLWNNEIPARFFQPLNQDHRTDVCVVGGGIAGLTTAYLLLRAGYQVTILTDGPIGGGETGRTTAHLASALDDRFYRLESLHGEEATKLAAASHTAAILQIETILHDEEISCDFEWLNGFLFLGESDTIALLKQEYDAAQRAGLEVNLLDRVPVDFWNSGPAIRFARQAQFHPLKYLNGLADAIIRHGGVIFTETHVIEMIDGGDKEACTVRDDQKHQVIADAVVVCTNTPVNDRVVMHTKQAAYRTYVVSFSIPRSSVPHMLYWDTLDPYHYVRVQKGDGIQEGADVLIVGGEDHKTGQAEETDQRFARLETWARVRFPMAQTVIARWSGQVMEPVDGLGFLGKNPGDTHTYIATGDSGHGMTHGTLAGMVISDLIAGRENPWSKLYDPSRITLRAAGEFAKENFNVVEQYKDWLTGGDIPSIDAVPYGSGAVVQRGIKKIAVYKDEHGKVYERSAVCPHLYCIVDWNDTEKSWDCPCHGSRFDAYGTVINGPAIDDLPSSNSEDD